MVREYSAWLPEQTITVPSGETEEFTIPAQTASNGNYTLGSNHGTYSTARAGNGARQLLDYVSGSLDYYQNQWWFYQAPLRFNTADLPADLISAKLVINVYESISDVAESWAVYQRGGFTYNLANADFTPGANLAQLTKVSPDVNLGATATGTFEFTLNLSAINTDGITYLLIACPFQASGTAPSQDERYHAATRPGQPDGPRLVVMASHSETPEPQPPTQAPGNVEGVPTQTSIAWTWSAVPGATRYRYEENGVGGTTTNLNRTTTGLEPGTPVTFRVRGENSDGNGPYSQTITRTTTTPDPDQVGGVVAAMAPAVRITWAALNGNYDVRRNGQTVATALNSPEYRDNNVTFGSTYTYEVRSDGGPWSSVATIQVVMTGGGGVGVRYLRRRNNGWV